MEQVIRKPGRPKKQEQEQTTTQAIEVQDVPSYRPPFRAQLTPEGWLIPERVTDKEPK